MALAELQQRAFYLRWETGPACEARFQDLFEEPRLEQVTRSQAAKLVTTDRAVVYADSDWFDGIWDRHAKETHSWEQFRDAAYAVAGRLKPIQAIADTVRIFAEKHSLEAAAGLHVRWTDNLRDYDRWEREVPSFRRDHVSRIEGFELFLRDAITCAGIDRAFLATDNRSVEQSLARSFAGELITFPKTYLGEHAWRFSLRRLRPYRRQRRTTSTREALTDLLLLSKCRIIVGTYFSSFGELAALLGPCELFTVIGDNYKRRSHVDRLAGVTPARIDIPPGPRAQ